MDAYGADRIHHRVIEAPLNGRDLGGQFGRVSPRPLRHALDHLRVNAADLHRALLAAIYMSCERMPYKAVTVPSRLLSGDTANCRLVDMRD
ncbi:hypothetical protein [Paracoccus rhizosphaerae]|uniref:Uncharacterized protein n=1 Tax=Paracoccus rhizosphaerae TaxID=1133347 RepID=A0ABV6CKX6_9RHOB